MGSLFELPRDLALGRIHALVDLYDLRCNG
jgi:hypothetical protein